MSVSSISTVPPPVPLKAPEPSPPTPAVKVDSSSNDNGSSQPTVAPLPPGQGTRVDQLA
jgi:hypothetical protein